MERRVIRRLISPCEYRHLRVWAAVHFAAAIILITLGSLLLSIGRYGWAVLLLVAAALHLWLGYVEMTLARSAPGK